MLSMIALLVCQTHAHASTYDNPLLNRLGPETLDNDRWKSGVCLASERIVVATITEAPQRTWGTGWRRMQPCRWTG